MTDIARIAIPRPLRQLFDYAIPPNVQVVPGQRLRVPFGRTLTTGIVVEISKASANNELKSIEPALEDWPALPPELLKSLLWAADYYQNPIGETLILGIPPALRRGQPAAADITLLYHPAKEISEDPLPKQAHRQQSLLNWLQQQTQPVPFKAIESAGFSRSLLKGLMDRKLVECSEEENSPLKPALAGADLPDLTPAQAAAFNALLTAEGVFSVSLLYGITGSGKTELYLHYLKTRLSERSQALVMIPEINLTPQTVARFERYFPGRILVWHSGLNDRERLQNWLSIRKGEPCIVIGTRSAALLPFIELDCVVVDEEHDQSYKQADGFRYSARDLVTLRARDHQCPVILGSATPSLESLHNALTGKYRLVRLEQRALGASLPPVRLLDIRSRPLTGGLAPPAMAAIERHLAAGEQVLVFVNRRGFAPVMMCFDCGHTVECPRCDSRLIYHRRDGAFRCHHCDFQQAAVTECPECKSHRFGPVGQGTERTEAVLEEVFPSFPVIRIDRDSTARKGSLETLLSKVRDGDPCILVGTQMLAKGHDFPKVTLVLVINADGALFSVDFRASEQLAQTLVQVSGRAGRSEKPGTVLLQTCHAEHPFLQELLEQDYLEVAQALLSQRQARALPPFTAMAVLRAEGRSMADALTVLDAAKQALNGQSVDVWGPIPALMARRNNHHRAQLTLRSKSRSRLRLAATAVVDRLASSRWPQGVRWHLDIDPIETA